MNDIRGSDRLLNASEMAMLSAKALNSPEYVSHYLAELLPMIGLNCQSILDTASGAGFPVIQLAKSGYRSLTASDIDEAALATLKAEIYNLRLPIKVYKASWDDLPDIVGESYDVILNVGHSFAYIDGWDADLYIHGGQFLALWRDIQARYVRTLRGFRRMLSSNGKLIIGLAKHYEAGLYKGEYGRALTANLQKVVIGNSTIDMHWSSNMDWDNRTHYWTSTASGSGYSGSITRRSYLFTKEELKEMMVRAKFRSVEIVETRQARDNFVVGYI